MKTLNDHTTTSLHEVAWCIEEADKLDLVPEVVVWALMAMKEDNSISVNEAIRIGFEEWIK